MRTLQTVALVATVLLPTITAAAPISDVEKELRDPEPSVRVAAIEWLGDYHTPPPAMLDLVVGCLEDKSPQVRVAALNAIWNLAWVNPSRLPRDRLEARLTDESPAVRAKAISIVMLQYRDERAARLVVERLEDENEAVRVAAIAALRYAGRHGTQALIKLLREGDPDVRAQVAEVFESLGFDGRGVAGGVVPALGTVLDDPEVRVRQAALRALCSIPAARSARIPLVVRGLRDEDPRVRATAATCLGGLGRNAASATGDLAKALADPEPQVRVAAANALQWLGRASAPAMEAVVRAIDDSHAEVRRLAVGILGEMGPKARSAVPDLVKVARTGADPRRHAAAWALGMIGHADEAVVSALSSLVESDEDAVRRNAVIALGRLGPRAASGVPALLEALRRKPDYDVPRSLAAISSDPERCVPALAKAVESDDWMVRDRVIGALAAFGRAAAPATPVLVDSLSDSSWTVRAEAARALLRVGEPAVPALRVAMGDGPPVRRIGAAAVLLRSGLERDAARALLLAGLGDAREEVGEEAVRLVAEIGVIDPQLVARVRDLLNGPDSLAGLRGAGAILKIGEPLRYTYSIQTAASVLVEGLRNKDSALRGIARRFLLSPAAGCEEALPILQPELHADDLSIRKTVLGAIGALGPEAGKAIPDLLRLLGDESVQDELLTAFSRIGWQAVPPLNRIVEDVREEPRIRVAAQEALRSARGDCF